MKATVLKRPFEMSIEEVPLPVPGPDEVLVQVKASAICGSDLKAFEGKHPLIKPPIVLGHEFSGVVAKKGSSVEAFQQGDRVVVEPSFACGRCFFCRSQAFYLCESLKQLGHQLPGSFAEYTVSKARFTYPLPENVPFEKGALTQPLAISIHAMDRAKVEKGQSLAILGMGAIGLLLLQVAKLRGARVFASDIVDFKLEKAKAMGAEEIWNGSRPETASRVRAWTEGRGADVVIEAAGSSATIDHAFSAVRRGGTILLLGLTGHEKEQVSLERVTLDELNVAGTMRYAHGDFQRAIGMLERGEIDLDALILRRFALAEAPGVFRETLRAPEQVLRSVMIA
jgi:2-desacetyl-2-hydroxyethyl bacteriochlorophyllide A dehydrogenase